MVTWVFGHKTPEYLDDLKDVVVTNNIAYKIRSFGIAGQFFHVVTKYADAQGPTTNSGARTSLADALGKRL